jgi:hypothetical protein
MLGAFVLLLGFTTPVNSTTYYGGSVAVSPSAIYAGRAVNVTLSVASGSQFVQPPNPGDGVCSGSSCQFPIEDCPSGSFEYYSVHQISITAPDGNVYWLGGSQTYSLSWPVAFGGPPGQNTGNGFGPALNVSQGDVFILPFSQGAGGFSFLSVAGNPPNNLNPEGPYYWWHQRSATTPEFRLDQNTGVNPTEAIGVYTVDVEGAIVCTGNIIFFDSAVQFSTTAPVLSPPTLVVVPSAIDEGQSVTESATVTWSGGVSPYSVTLYSGSSSDCSLDTNVVAVSAGTNPVGGVTGTSTVFSFASPLVSTYYCATVTDSSVPSQTATSPPETVTVNPALSPPTIEASPGAIDSGQSSTLSTTTSFSGGTSPYACQWLEEAPGSSSYSDLGSSFACTTSSFPTTPTGTLSTTGAWNFELQVTDSSAAPVTVASSPVTVTVNPALSVSVTPVTIDSGQTATLTAVPSGGSGSYPTYTWYPGSTCSGMSLQSSASASYDTGILTSTTTYCVKVTDSLGDTATTTVVVTVNSALIAPVISASPKAIVSGQSSTLSTTTSFSGGTSTYTCQWLEEAPGASEYTDLGSSFSTSGGCTTSGTPSTPTGTLSTTGVWNFELQVTDSSGTPVTVASAAATVTVNAAPGPLSVSVTPVTIDSGQTATLTAVPSGGSGSYPTYTWYPGSTCSGMSLQSSASASYDTGILTSTTTYCVKVTDSLGDTATTTVVVTVEPSSVVHGLLGAYYLQSFFGTPLPSVPGCATYADPPVPTLPPTAQRIDPDINFGAPTHFRWVHDGFTVEGVPFVGVEFSVRWTGFIDITTPGSYTFGLKSDDGSWLYIDGLIIVNDSGAHAGNRLIIGNAALNPGLHSIEVGYYETCGDSHSGIDLYWIPPGTSRPVIIPTEVLIPPANPYTTTMWCTSSFAAGTTAAATCTAAVNGSSPTGTVYWFRSGPGGVSFSPASCTLSSGHCQVNVTGTALGFVTLNASYAGDQNNPPGSVAFTVNVGQAATTKTTVSCSPTAVVIGSSRTIRCTAKVTGYSPTGTVRWSQIGTGSVSLSSATCTLTSVSPHRGACSVAMTGATVGLVILRATYGGDPANQGSSRPTALTIKMAPTATVVACTPSSVTTGFSSITCTATVSGSFPSQTGTVTWSRGSGKGSVVFSPMTCILSSGTCSASVSVYTTNVGSIKIKATYSGDSDNLRSLGTLFLTVT